MIKLLITIGVSLIVCSFALAQNPNESASPGAEAAMLKFVELNNKQLLQSDEARKLLIGDAAKWDFAWFGQVFSKPDKIVPVERNYSVARIQAVEKNSRVVDLYFYLKFNDGWRIRSMRAMAQTGFLEAIITVLKSKPALSAEEKETLANIELVLSSDKMLTEWFQKNRPALENLSKVALLETKKKPPRAIPPPQRKIINGENVTVGISQAATTEDDEPQTIETVNQNARKFPKTAAALKNLHLSALETKSNGNVEIIVGGITDNSVGLIYSPAGTPPPIDGRRYIWVEKIAPGWYLYRTT